MYHSLNLFTSRPESQVERLFLRLDFIEDVESGLRLHLLGMGIPWQLLRIIDYSMISIMWISYQTSDQELNVEHLPELEQLCLRLRSQRSLMSPLFLKCLQFLKAWYSSYLERFRLFFSSSNCFSLSSRHFIFSDIFWMVSSAFSLHLVSLHLSHRPNHLNSCQFCLYVFLTNIYALLFMSSIYVETYVCLFSDVDWSV